MTKFCSTVGGTAWSIVMGRYVVILMAMPYIAVAFRGVALSSQILLRQQDTPRTCRLMHSDDGGLEEGQPSSSSSWTPAAADGASSNPATPLSEDELVRRILTGYDSAQAAALSAAEVAHQTRLWAQKSGVVGDFFGDELYTELLSVKVVRGSRTGTTSMVHDLADFWQAVAQIIHAHTDHEVFPPRWLSHPRNATMTSGSGKDWVHMIVLPDNTELYDYSTFTTLLTAVEFSKELCVHFGRHFSLTAFHPHFKNSPKLFSPERHSPFPVIGLQYNDAWKDSDLPLGHKTIVKPIEQSKKDDNGKILPHPETELEDSDIGALADANIKNLDQTRAHFEVLFNSAAALNHDHREPGSTLPSSTSEEATVKRGASSSPPTLSAADLMESLSDEEQLAKTFRQERQRRTGNLPAHVVRQVTAQWMDEQRYADSSKRHLNPALEFMDTVDGCTVCTQKMGELVYSEMWQAIRLVYEKGLAADAAPVVLDKEVSEESDKSSRFDLSQWMHSLSNDGGARKKQADSDVLPQVTSMLFVATKFNMYNAQNFKRFAITINAALKRITGGRMFLEVFHPEYVGNKGYNHALRRSPFPMIQICYLVEQNETKAP